MRCVAFGLKIVSLIYVTGRYIIMIIFSDQKTADFKLSHHNMIKDELTQ